MYSPFWELCCLWSDQSYDKIQQLDIPKLGLRWVCVSRWEIRHATPGRLLALYNPSLVVWHWLMRGVLSALVPGPLFTRQEPETWRSWWHFSCELLPVRGGMANPNSSLLLRFRKLGCFYLLHPFLHVFTLSCSRQAVLWCIKQTQQETESFRAQLDSVMLDSVFSAVKVTGGWLKVHKIPVVLMAWEVDLTFQLSRL